MSPTKVLECILILIFGDGSGECFPRRLTRAGIKRSVLPQPVMEELDHRRPVSEGIPLLHQEVDEEGGNAREEPNRLTILIVAQPWTGLVTAERMASLFSDTTCESREMACFSGGGRNGSLPRVIVSQDGSHKMLQKMASLGPLRGAVFTRDPRSAWPCRATKRSKQLLGEAVRVVEGGRGPAANLTIVRVEDIRRSPMEMCSALADSFGLDDDHGTAWKEACSRASEQTSSLRDAGPGIEPCWGISNTPAGDDEERHVAEALSGPLAIGLGYS